MGENLFNAPQSKLKTTQSTQLNCGYDDERGDYLLQPHDHVQYRYEIISLLGKVIYKPSHTLKSHKLGARVGIVRSGSKVH